MKPIVLLYNLLLLILLPLIFALLEGCQLLSKKKVFRGFGQRLRPFPDVAPHTDSEAKRIWIHAASVGEVKVAGTLINGIRERFPRSRLFLTAFTDTGLKEAAKLPFVEAVSYPPLDIPPLTRSALKRVSPDLFLLIEAEFWPNLLNELKRRGIPTLLINGRISTSSLKAYSRLPFFKRLVLHNLDKALMRNKTDAERIMALGMPQERVQVTGNIKFDGVLSDRERAELKPFNDILRPAPEEKIVIFSNTRNGEETLLMPVIKKVVSFGPASVIVAPRHLNRLSEVEETFKQAGLSTVRWSQLRRGEAREASQVLLLDVMGVLFPIYGICHIAFVGGSLLPFGGHNILEPAAFAIPVLFGPRIDNFQEEATILKKSGGGIQAASVHDLDLKITDLLKYPDEARRIGRAARKALEGRGGALVKCLAETRKQLTTNTPRKKD